MAFPIGPVNNQTAVVNGITYVYSSANNAWTRVTATDLTLAGNLTTGGNVTVTGNLVVQGNTTTLNTETLTVEDLNITVANGAASAATADGAGLTVAGANARLLYKSATDSWVFDKGVFASGNLVANSGTTSTSTTTGALVVSGGAGISGSLYINNTNDVSANIGTLFNGNISTNANLGAFQTFSNANAATQATSINTINANIGAYQTYANANVVAIQANLGAFQTYANANIGTLFNGNISTNANLGAFQTYANTKIGTNTNSNLVVQATTAATSTTTGALVVRGGAGIAGNVYTDKLYTTNGLYWAGNGAAFSGGATLGFPNSTVAIYPTGDYGDFTATKDAFGVHIDTTYDCMEPIGSYSTVDLNT